MRRHTILLLVLILATGCLDVASVQRQLACNAPREDASPEAVRRRLLRIASSYLLLDSPDQHMRKAGFVCDFAPTNFVSGISPERDSAAFTHDLDLPVRQSDSPRRAFAKTHMSKSNDDDTHGKKLYLIFARYCDENGYVAIGPGGNKIGQVIVKEAWVPEDVTGSDRPREMIYRPIKPDGSREVVDPYVHKNGRDYRAKEVYGLFIMYKLDPRTPGTDEGWVYGTVSPDGRTIQAAGKLESCMKCHSSAPHDRLFGYGAD